MCRVLPLKSGGRLVWGREALVNLWWPLAASWAQPRKIILDSKGRKPEASYYFGNETIFISIMITLVQILVLGDRKHRKIFYGICFLWKSHKHHLFVQLHCNFFSFVYSFSLLQSSIAMRVAAKFVWICLFGLRGWY